MAVIPENSFPGLKTEDFLYHLPEEAIAKYPLTARDQSRLLFYNRGEISHHIFGNIPHLLPPKSRLFFNNTKVIPARLFFSKETGAKIEIFLLQPAEEGTLISEVLGRTHGSTWLCLIGNLKRWKEGSTLERKLLLNGEEVSLLASLESAGKGLVRFHWNSHNVSFAELVEAGGEVPLPPYLNRKAEENDKKQYQTIYSLKEGAVAAPTAGLHFTEEVMAGLEKAGVSAHYLTLHVSAGTFRPIKGAIENHPMHREQVVSSRAVIAELIKEGGKVIAVGTTSMRTLESLYWYGVKLLKNPEAPFFISKEEAYGYKEENLPGRSLAFSAVLEKMERDRQEELWGETEIFIVPSYRFRVCQGLITNFHQPESTLILLVAAFLGQDWRRVYQEALSSKYRFLSYGDSSLLLPA